MKTVIAVKMNPRIATVGLALGLSAFVAFAQQNLIVNGSFESGGRTTFEEFPGWDAVGPASNNSNYGITNSRTAPRVAQEGSFFAWFRGHPTDSSQDCLGQTVHLTVGAEYTVSYYLATDGATLGSGAAMWVVIGTSFGIDLSQDVMLTEYRPNSPSALPYQKFTTNVIATSPSEILSFHGITEGGAILLDNVTMTLAGPPPPRLAISRSPTNSLVFTWTSATNGFRLQASGALGATNWATLTNAPSTSGSSHQIVLPEPADRRFYRLALP